MHVDELAELCRKASESRLQILAIQHGRPVARPTVKTVKGGFHAGLMSVRPDGGTEYFWSTGLGHMSRDRDKAKRYTSLRESKQVAIRCFDDATKPLKKPISLSRERVEIV